MAPPKLYDLRAFAELAGIAYSTMRKYHQRAEQRRKEHAADPTVEVAAWMLPEPDARVGQSPVWTARTAKKWAENRPRAGGTQKV